MNYIPVAVPTGPAVDVLPEVSPDGTMIHLRVIPTWAEFLGYDEPKPFVAQGIFSGDTLDPPLEVQRPLPHFQVRQTLANMNVQDDETIVISGFGRLAASPKNPNRGRSSQAKSGAPRQIIIFVTPVIVDSAGHRVHAL